MIHLQPLGHRLFSLVVIIAFFLGVYSSFFRNEHSRNMLMRAIGQTEGNANAKFISQVDAFYDSRFPDGNTFIHFEGLEAKTDGSFVFAQFIRASYHNYPRKVLVGPPEITLQSAADILANNSLPSNHWLRDHGVTRVLTYEYRNGRPNYTISDVPEAN